MQNLLNDVTQLLAEDERLVVDGKLLKNKVIELALNVDVSLIKLLLKNAAIKQHFFTQVDNVLVFDKIKFQQFVSNKQFLADSYTAFKNKIGLTANGEYLTDSREVVLAWAYKDCVLEGGQDKDDAKRNEVFYNETLAPDQIDRLLSPKLLTNFKRYGKDGVQALSTASQPIISSNDNLIIKGNNLLALHTLKKVYAGKVKLIYIDPPYNTGNDSFGYNDSFNHSTWLTFMRNRLKVAHELLSISGSIFISIDHNQLGYLITLINEIFKEENQKNIVTVKRSSVSGAKVINPGVVNVSEYILIYSKNALHWQPNKAYKEKERDGRYSSFIKNLSENPESWTYCSVLEAFAESIQIKKSALKKHFKESYEIELKKFYFQNKNKIIRFAGLDETSVSEKVNEIKKLSKLDGSKTFVLHREEKSTYYLYNGNAILFFKDRLIQVDGQDVFGEMVSDIWDDVLPNDIHNEGGVTLRKGKKPEKLIQRIIELGTSKNDIVLDFHTGSGTAAAVAHKMGRQYIGIEQMNYIEDITLERMQRVIAGEQSGISKDVKWTGGGSFVYCELARANQTFIDDISASTIPEQLQAIWQTMQERAFLSYQIDVKAFDANAADFAALRFADQQRFLIEVLDKNMLYVPLSEMDDAVFGITDNDKALNKQFFGL